MNASIIDTHAQLSSAPRNDKFYTRRGRLTRYALACGYIERYSFNSAKHVHEVRMYMSSACIFVRTEDEVIYAGNNLQSARDTFDAEMRAIKSVFRK